MARRAVWTREIHRVGRSDPFIMGRSSPQVLREARLGARGIRVLLAIQKSYELLAKHGSFAREIFDTCGIVLGAVVSRGTANRKCTALVNVGAMLLGLRPSGRDVRANTKPTANVEPQRRDSSSSIGWHPNVEKTVRIPSETKSLQKQKLSLSYSGIRGPAEPVSSRGRTPFPSSIAVGHSWLATISFPFREVQGVTAMSRLSTGNT
jgi:hypothetical protein